MSEEERRSQQETLPEENIPEEDLGEQQQIRREKLAQIGRASCRERV